ncbi:hypothetical protein [Clostridium sp. Marseille-Q7071]
MNLFYEFLSSLNDMGYKSYEDEITFKLEFKSYDRVKKLVSYNLLQEMKTCFSNFISLYICSSINDEQNLFDYLDNLDDFNEETERLNDNYSFKLIFRKHEFIKSQIEVDDKLLYFVEYSNFINYLNKDIKCLEDLLDMHSKNIFIMGNSNDFFYNNFYMITNVRRNDYKEEIYTYCNHTTLINTEDIIKKRNQLCNWINSSQFLTPDCFYVNIEDSRFNISNNAKIYLYKKTIDMIIPFISNFTGNNENQYLSIINGSKRIEVKYDLNLNDYEKDSYYNLFKLYSWIYENSTFDKITICRNVISILVSAKCQGSVYKTILNNSDWLVKSVEGNFKDFLMKNIESFFKEKNTAIERLNSNIIGINNQISELTKLTITNMTSLLATIIAGVLGYVAKGDYVFIKMLSFLYTIFLYINCFFNLPISIIRAVQYNNDFQFNSNLYRKHHPDDDNIMQLMKRNSLNRLIFRIYTVASILIIILITYFVLTTDIRIFIKKFE